METATKATVLQEYTEAIATNVARSIMVLLQAEETGKLPKGSLMTNLRMNFSETVEGMATEFINMMKGLPDDLAADIKENRAEYLEFVKDVIMQIAGQMMESKGLAGHASLKDALIKIAEDKPESEQKPEAAPKQEAQPDAQPDSLTEFTTEDRAEYVKTLDRAARKMDDCAKESFEEIQGVMTDIIKDKKYTVNDKLDIGHNMWETAKEKLDESLLGRLQDLLQSWFPSDEFK